MCEVYVPLINYNNVQGICVYQYLQSIMSIMRQESLHPITGAHDEEGLPISLYVCINNVLISISL